MRDLLLLITRHGYAVVGLAVFLEAVGVPVPAALILFVAGVGAALNKLSLTLALPCAVAAMMLGDSLLYVLGRRTGWFLLGYLCRISANPESCILRSAESFYKRGRVTLVIAKFVPGVNAMAAPLAGSMNMSPGQFLRLDFLGVSLYTVTYSVLGFACSGFAESVVRQFHLVGRGAEYLVVAAMAVYVGYYAWLYWKQRAYQVVPRVPVEEVARQLMENPSHVLLIDVRSHGYYDPGAVRIQGSVRLEPNKLKTDLGDLSKEKAIYLYCT
ncbi:MAG TPA: VTT domain-containing protein [Terriglobales bacterium]|nr:VTT domain-containing protein [Terriglobales bacterium]